MDSSPHRYQTRVVHAGQAPDPTTGALTTPVVRSAPFVFRDLDHLEQVEAGESDCFEYARSNHPTAKATEAKLAAIESADDAIVTATGMAALTTALLALLDQGDHVLATDDGYKRSLTFIRDTLPRWGIIGELVDSRDPVAAVAAALRPETRLVFCEVPSNPHLRMTDIPALAAACHANGTLLLVDATIASPYNLRPLELGADLVVHSATKFLAGHNDVLCGSIAGGQDLLDRIRTFHQDLGASLGPDECYLLLRGIKTLAVRVEQANRHALALAQWLAAQPLVSVVHYPGLADSPGHALAARDMTGFGGMLSFELATDLAGVKRFVAALEVISLGTSLGGVETLLLHLATVMRNALSAEDLARFGLSDQLLRLSVGLEDLADLRDDLARGLAAVAG